MNILFLQVARLNMIDKHYMFILHWDTKNVSIVTLNCQDRACGVEAERYRSGYHIDWLVHRLGCNYVKAGLRPHIKLASSYVAFS